MTLFALFFGPPGVGKGTQAQRAAEEFSLPHISTGDMFRAEQSADTPLGQELDSFMSRGALVPDELTSRVVLARLAQDDVIERGFILDGYPRTQAQADSLDSAMEELVALPIDRVINFTAPDAVLIARIAGRRVCPQCRSTYHVPNRPPRTPDQCDRDGATLEQREDDQELVVRQRLQTYAVQTAPLIAFYRARKVLTNVAATAGADIVYSTVQKILQRHQ